MAEVPQQNVLIDCQQPHAEVIEIATRTVWQSVEPISEDSFQALALPEGIARVGLGCGVMDAHYFRQSPGADAPGPVTDRFIDGRRFIHCANPPAAGADRPPGDGPLRLVVDKHHTLIFDAGSDMTLIRTEGGSDLIQVISASPQGGGLLQQQPAQEDALQLPRGWQLRVEHAAERTVIELPNPTEAWFFDNGASFQGPVTGLA
ncbi:MAG: hypothetical protein NXH85_11945 [Pseudomonadaceae bacterium]|nr:hypothetical protein [Pseudomonadaceae bacterium]